MSDFDLKLPIIPKDSMPPPELSMDEYFHFVEFYSKNIMNQEAYRQWMKISAVNVPFTLKD